MTIKEMKMAWR
jgi:hypothetical protein